MLKSLLGTGLDRLGTTEEYIRFWNQWSLRISAQDSLIVIPDGMGSIRSLLANSCTTAPRLINSNFSLLFQDLSEEAPDGRPLSPCNVVFVGDNIVPSKSSLSSKPKTKKVRAAVEAMTYWKERPRVTRATRVRTQLHPWQWRWRTGRVLAKCDWRLNFFRNISVFTPIFCFSFWDTQLGCWAFLSFCISCTTS